MNDFRIYIIAMALLGIVAICASAYENKKHSEEKIEQLEKQLKEKEQCHCYYF